MAPTLLTRTQAYWKISMAWHGRGGAQQVRTGDALSELGDVSDVTFYKRPLRNHVQKLRQEIINGNRRKKSPKQKVPTPVTYLRQQEGHK